MKKIIIIIAIIISAFNVKAQTVTGNIVNEQQEPIPYASVLIGPTYGVVSNTDGAFIIQIPEEPEADKVTISSLGYESIEVPLSNFKQGAYVLKEQTTILDEVFITNVKLTPTEILTKVVENAPKNYGSQTLKQTFFLRSSNTNRLIDSEVELVRSSLVSKSKLKEVNKEMESIMKRLLNQSSENFSEYYGSLYQHGSDTKLNVEKAIELKNKERDISSDQVSKKLIDILKKHLEHDASYKLKSGLFTLDDSLTINKPQKEEKPGSETASLRTTISSLTRSLNRFYTQKELDFLTEFKRYKYTLEGYSTFNDETIYIINFEPEKNSARYYGKIYVNATDYAVVKLDYNLVDGKKAESINLKLLLGVKVVEDRVKVSALYTKNEEGLYSVNFVKREKRSYIYAHRSLKLTKNKEDEDEDKKMLKMDVLIEIDTHATNELFIIDKESISNAMYEGFREEERYDINYLSKYDPSVWKDYNALAPVDAIRNYK